MNYSPPGSSILGILQIRILEWLPYPPPGDLPNPGIELVSLKSPALSGAGGERSLPLVPPGRPLEMNIKFRSL